MINSTADSKWLAAVLADAKQIEIRHLPSGTSKFTSTPQEVQEGVSGLLGSGSLYTTLNRPIGLIPAGSGRALGNEDIGKVVFLPFDFDPVRPTGTNSTTGELADAVSQRNLFVRAMLVKGWPMPASGMSGNGAHAVYRTFAPNNAETRQVVKSAYRRLAELFGNETVSFDRSVSNPGRIWRLYGTINRKGQHTSDRPQRIATVALPADWRRLDFRLLEKVANEAEAKRPVRPQQVIPRSGGGSGDYCSLNVVAWFQARDHYRDHIERHIHAVICPFANEHTSADSFGDAVIFESDGGWPGFHCKHAHCAGRSIRDVLSIWPDADAYCARQYAEVSV